MFRVCWLLVVLLAVVATQALLLQDLSIILANPPQILGHPGPVRCYVVRCVVLLSTLSLFSNRLTFFFMDAPFDLRVVRLRVSSF